MPSAGVALACRIEGALIVRVSRVTDVQASLAREELAVAGIPGGHDAVEHVDAPCNRLDNVQWCSRAHEVPGLVDGQAGRRRRGDLVHHLIGLADAQAPDGVALEPQVDGPLRTLISQRLVHSSLDDAKKRLAGV